MVNYQLVFRSRWGSATAIAIALIGLVFVAMIWGSDGPGPAIAAAALPLAMSYFTWWVWAWPAVIADRRGITVRNQLRTYRIGWDSFREALSQYGLYLLVAPAADAGQGGADGPAPNRQALREQFPLTGGEVEPAKRIYAAGAPARGGFAVAHQKTAPTVPDIYLERGPRVTLRVQPPVAATMLNEERAWLSEPRDRPMARQASEQQVRNWESRSALSRFLHGVVVPEDAEPFRGVVAVTNWGVLGGLVLVTALAAYVGFTL